MKMAAMTVPVGRTNYIAEKKENGSGDGMLWEHATYPRLKNGITYHILFHNCVP